MGDQSRIPSAFQLVRLAEADLPGVIELEKEAYAQPWTAENFIGEFQRRITLPLGFKNAGQVVAHCFFWLLPPEIHLLNVAVKPEFRRLGLARRLLEAMVVIGRRGGAETVFLEARAGNIAAIRLYESIGFITAGRRPGYYEDGEDALLMNMEIK
ncbi:ribosomal protein S18-alanine N-acetyltransferase [Deltaproteobacteria bacterium OttesenSCG-928-K17]|nr:ribosomal protein S18-alanine N-acetyltransferase [Deltaproteobacteria bacterium OttesenSCG-928-K17]